MACLGSQSQPWAGERLELQSDALYLSLEDQVVCNDLTYAPGWGLIHIAKSLQRYVFCMGEMVHTEFSIFEKEKNVE